MPIFMKIVLLLQRIYTKRYKDTIKPKSKENQIKHIHSKLKIVSHQIKHIYSKTNIDHTKQIPKIA